MDIVGFAKVAQYLTHPMVLVGFVGWLLLTLYGEIVKSGLLPRVTQKKGGEILTLIIKYGAWLFLFLMLCGFALSAWNSYIDAEAKQLQKEAEQLREINQRQIAEQYFLKEQIKAKDRQIETKDQQLNSLTEAVATIGKTDVPAKMKQQAFEAMRQGNAEQAKNILAKLLQTKEAEGLKANKEAAEAARSMGALAFMNNTKEALAAYQKAVELAPDNADGWNMLGRLLKRTGELAKAEEAYRRVLALGKQDKEVQAAAYGNLGHVYRTRGDLVQAEHMYKKSLEISEALGRKEGMAGQYGNLGLVYADRGDLAQAEHMYKKSLEISEPLGLKETTANQSANLGIVYKIRGELEQAEQMHKKALEINDTLGRKEGMAKAYGNLGLVYADRGDLAQAEQMYNKSFKIHEALGSKEGMARDYGNLGNIYQTRGEFVQAEQMHKKALEINEALGSKEGMARDYGNLGLVYAKRGEFKQAEEMWQKSLHMYQAVQHPNAKMIQQWLDKLAQQKASTSQ